MNTLHSLLVWLIAPHTKQEAPTHQEFILNIVLLGTVLLAFLTLICLSVKYLYSFYSHVPYLGTPLWSFTIVILLFLLLLFISKKGYSQFVALSMIALYFIVATYTAFSWGADVPQALLIFAIGIVVAGILLGTKFAFWFTLLIGITLLILAYNQESGALVVQQAWKTVPLRIEDEAIFIMALSLLAIISWLYNREVASSLKKAHDSETVLKKERDLLETKVEERTRQLKQLQLEKMMQLYRFAEFGRIASGLFHDLSIPVTSMMLELELLEYTFTSTQKINTFATSMAKAKMNVQRIEEFVTAARQQIQKQNTQDNFSLNQEIHYVIQILEYKARQHHVALEFQQPTREVVLYGNALKINQVITNLISNAIDAYQVTELQKKVLIVKVRIKIQETRHYFRIFIQDWGSGIPVAIQPFIFQPLFTTKSKEMGMGIGLSISREIVQKDFAGALYFHSQEGKGSVFVIILPKLGR